MRAKLIVTAVTLSLTVACGQEPTEPKQPIVVRSEAQDGLHQLDEMNRAIALKRALYASGYRCQRVEQSGFVTTYKNLDMWTARCDDGRDWALFAGPDGSVQVRDCKDVAQFGMPACVIRKPSSRS